MTTLEQPFGSSQIFDQPTFKRTLAARKRRAGRWQGFFLAANLLAILMLAVLFLSIINQSFGLVVVEYETPPATLSSRPLEELSKPELVAILQEKVGRNRLRVLVRDNLIGKHIDPAKLTGNQAQTMAQLMDGKTVSPELAPKKFSELTLPDMAKLLGDNLSEGQLSSLIMRDVAKPNYVASWNLFDSIFKRSAIAEEAAAKYPKGVLQFKSWLTPNFILSELASNPAVAGLRPALIGSLWVIGLTLLIAVPLGIGAAIFLEEYAERNRLNSIIETNIRNLAGVPSIIYGMLGLAIFVRALEPFTSGKFVGITDSNGRTVISAAFTMALLILPVVIINAQEAIRAVPWSIREASYGIGATKWQTVSRQVLPAAFPGILTGLILSVSRAVGETAPLIVVGGLTFLTNDPNGPFSKFSVIPIQIYSWTTEPSQQFKNVAAAAIIVLLIALLSMNAAAIVMRQRISKQLRG